MDTLIFDQTPLPKPLCQITSGFLNPGFSLETFLEDKTDLVAGVFDSNTADIFLQTMGVSKLLKDPACTRSMSPYNGIKGWLSDCPAIPISRLTRVPVTGCYLSTDCSRIDCCTHSDMLGRGFSYYLHIDACGLQIEMGIEGHELSYSLKEFVFGTEQVFDLKGFFKLRLRIDDIEVMGVYVVSLHVQMCYDSSQCAVDLNLLSNLQLPKEQCNLATGYALSNFSVANWISDKGLSLGSNLSSLVSGQLYEAIGIGGYLTDTCQQMTLPAGQWTNDCPTSLSLPSLDPLLACQVSRSCTNLTCCVTVPVLDRLFSWNFDFRPCHGQLSFAIEGYRHTISLLNMGWGKKQLLTLSGLIKIEYRVFDITAENVYLIDLSLAVCLDATTSPCDFSVDILQGTRLSKEACNWATQSIASGFSFDDWLQTTGQLAGQLDTYAAITVLDQLGLTSFLSARSCNIKDLRYNNNDNNSTLATECSSVTSPVVLPNDVGCLLSSDCSTVECCVFSPTINRAFFTKVQLDSCHFTLTIQIEEFTHTQYLYDYTFGTQDTISLLGVFTIRYKIEELLVDQVYVLDLEVTMCLDATFCPLRLVILDKTWLAKPTCSGINQYSLPGFSLSSWVSNLDPTLTPSTLTLDLESVLMNDLGLTSFLGNTGCNSSNFASGGIDTTACSLSVSVPASLNSSLSCHLMPECSGLECCLDVPYISKNVNLYARLFPCTFSLVLGIGDLKLDRSLINYEFGKVEQLWLGGVFRFRFSVHDLVTEMRYLVSMSIDVCWSNTECERFVVMKDQLLPKLPCSFKSSFNIPDFSLTSWLAQNAPSTVGQLGSDFTKILLGELGLADYLNDQRCQGSSYTYSPNTNGWKSQCERTMPELPILASGLTCLIPDTCTSVQCCIDLQDIDYSLEAAVEVDFCSQFLSVRVEKFHTNVSLNDYTYGQTDEFWLMGIVRMSYRLDELKMERKLLVSLNMSVCLETSASCSQQYEVLKEVKLPKSVCDWGSATAGLQVFSLTNWLSNNQIGSLGSMISTDWSLLYETLGISAFLLDQPCVHGVSPFTVNGGFLNECPLVTMTASLPSSVACHLGPSCTSVDCCANVPELGRTIRPFFYLSPCNSSLTLGIEKFSFYVNLLDYEFGQKEHFWLRNVIRVDFVLFDLAQDDQYMLDMDLSLCFEDSCSLSTTLLNSVLLPKPVCSLNNGFKISGFSMASWLSSNSLNSNIPYPALLKSTLLQELGIAKYLGEGCSLDVGTIVNGWNNSCASSQSLPSLPSEMSCKLTTGCNNMMCCVSLGPLQTEVQLDFLLDWCNYELFLSIDWFSVQISMLDIDWGTTYNISMNGIFNVQLSVDDFSGQNTFVVSLSVQVCLEDGGTCLIQQTIFDKTSFPKPLCSSSLVSTFPIDDFSLLEWMQSQSLSLTDKVDAMYTNIVLNNLGLAEFIRDSPCTVITNDWTTTCPQFASPALPDSMSCSLTSDCSKLECCFSSQTITKSVALGFILDPCNFEMTIFIENFMRKISLFNYDWGVSKRLSFGGIFRLDYNIVDLKYEGLYQVSANLSTCFESRAPCALELTFLDKVFFHKKSCDWNVGFYMNDFSLQTWLSNHTLVPGATLDAYHTAKLFEETNLSPFLLDQQCQVNTTKWTSRCPYSVDLGSLPNYMSCEVSDTCTVVTCCVYVDALARSFSLTLDIDPCTYELQLSVEKMTFRKELLTYQWGSSEVLSLFNIVKLGTKLYDIQSQGKFLVTMSTEVCLESTTSCMYNVSILHDVFLPKIACNWNSDFIDSSFSLSAWLSNQGLSASGQIPDNYLTLLKDELGLTPYMKDTPCAAGSAPFNNPVNRWINDCPDDVTRVTLPANNTCHIPTMCTGVECCVQLSPFQTNVHIKVFVDTCNYAMDIAIDQLAFSIDLFNYTWGTQQDLSLQGVVRVRFTAEDLQSEGKVLLSVAIATCYSATDTCSFSLDVFKNVRLPKPTCTAKSAFVDPTFSLTSWLSSCNAVAGSLSSLEQSLVLEELGISRYLQTDSCTLVPGNSTSYCPASVDLQPLPAQVSCVVFSSCTNLGCCLQSQRLGINFYVGINIDPCNQRIRLNIEKYTEDIAFEDIQWGTQQEFVLYGAINIRFTVEDLVLADAYLVSVEAELCLESGGSCDLTTPLLDNAILPKVQCTLDSDFLVKNFSLTSWLSSKGYTYNRNYLGMEVTSNLLEQLGIVRFMAPQQCDRNGGIYLNSNKGWSKSCPYQPLLETLPNMLTCHLSESCTGVECCVDVYMLETSFNLQLEIDPCNLVMELRIEQLAFNISLEDYVWGTSKKFCLLGVICMEFVVDELFWYENYLMDLNMSVCLESGADCLLDVVVMSATKLPKRACTWTDPALIQGFSLATWKQTNGAPSGSSLPSYLATKLLNDLGLSPFLSETSCNITHDATCTSACPLLVPMPTVPSGSTCSILNTCTGVDVCVNVPAINRNVKVFMRLNDCNQNLEIGIENYVFNITLFDFEFGKLHQLILRSVFKIEFRIIDLSMKSTYLVDLTFSVCFTSTSSCETVITVFDQSELPKLPCAWDRSFLKPDFSLMQWFSVAGTNTSTLSEVEKLTLLEDMGVAWYMQEYSCYMAMYGSDSTGWASDCSGNVPLATLPSYLTCYLSDTCLSVDCCLNADAIDTRVHFSLEVDACNNTLTVGIEQVTHTEALDTFSFGDVKQFYLNGVFRLDYLIELFQGGRQYVLYMNASVCLEHDQSCQYSTPILTRSIQPKVSCDWQQGFKDPAFSLANWMTNNTFDNNNLLSSVEADVLFEYLDIAQYLREEECAIGNPPFISPVNGWINECAALPVLPALPSEVVCHMGPSCTKVECCLSNSDIPRNFYLLLDIDDCNYLITISIEGLNFTRSLAGFQFDTDINFDLDGLVVLRFRVSQLSTMLQYIVSMEVAVVTDASGAGTVTSIILQQITLPMMPCSLEQPFVNLNFSLTSWRSSHNLDPVARIEEYHTKSLLEELRVAPYMMDTDCTISPATFTNNCPTTVDLPSISQDAHCSLSDSCTGVTCCVDSGELTKTFQVELDIKSCLGELVVKLEQISYYLDLENQTLGVQKRFNMFGILGIDLLVEEVVSTRLYEITMVIHVCFEANSPCNYLFTVFNHTLLPMLPCNWESGFLNPAFNRTKWMDDNGYDANMTTLSGPALSKYYRDIGVTSYMQSSPCSRSLVPYTPSVDGWNNECPSSIVSMRVLSNASVCHLGSSCLDIECCMTDSFLGSSVHMVFSVDACAQMLTVGLENVVRRLALADIETGVEQKFYINGFLKLEFSIENIPLKRVYVVNMRLFVCLDNTECPIQEALLTNSILPQPVCGWTTDFNIPGFSLTNWLTANGQSDMYNIDSVTQLRLLDEMALSPYLMYPACGTLDPAVTTDGWLNDCPTSVPLEPLTGNTTCHLSMDCEMITCCVASPPLHKNVQFTLHIDTCNLIMNVSMETFSRSKSLYNYAYGTQETMTLYGALSMSFTLLKLETTNQYKISASLSHCFDAAGPCLETILLLEDAFIPRQDCPLDAGFHGGSFSLTQWVAEHTTASLPLTGAVSDMVIEDLGLTQFMDSTICNGTNDLYQPSIYGWKYDCPTPPSANNVSDYDMSCFLDSSCARIDCCKQLTDLGTNLSFSIHVEPCELVVLVRMGKLERALPIADVLDKTTTISLEGIFRINLDLSESGAKYIISLSVAICQESSALCTTETIFDRSTIPKEACTFNATYEINGFSLTSWLSQQNASLPLTPVQLDSLILDTGLQHFLNADQCQQTVPAGGNELNLTAVNSTTTCWTLEDDLKIDCCLYSAVYQRNIFASLHVDACNYQILAKLEGVNYTIPLLGYDWGIQHELTMKGIWRLRFMVNNVQTNKQFNVDLQLDECTQSGSSCAIHIPVVTNFLVNYTACNVTLPGEQRQPYYDISYDFWKMPYCSPPIATSACAYQMPAALASACVYDDDCGGITCCIDLAFGSDRRTIYMRFAVDCTLALTYELENKVWTNAVSAVAGQLHFRNITNAMSLNFELVEAGMEYLTSANITICSGISAPYICEDNPILDQVQLKKLSCPGGKRRRRRRRSVQETDATSMNDQVTRMLKDNATDDELRALLDAISEVEGIEKEVAWQGSELGDDDKSTSYQGSLKAMGSNNPSTLQNRGPVYGITLSAGGKDIASMIGGGSGNSTTGGPVFVVGEGLSAAGVDLLGEQLANMSLGDLEALLYANKVDPLLIQDLVNDFMDLAKALYSEVMEKLLSGGIVDTFKSMELALAGKFDFPRKDIVFWTPDPSFMFMIGGIVQVKFTFGAYGYFGVDFGWKAKLLEMTATADIAPKAGLVMYGELAVGNLLFVKLRIDGEIMELRFPTVAEVGFSKFPMDIALTMDMELIPVKLKLKALVTLEVTILGATVKKTLFEKQLWYYEAPKIVKRIIDLTTKEEDNSPPVFSDVVQSEGSKKRRSLPGCVVLQVPNKDYTEPTFEISVAAADDKADVKLLLDVGTYPAGTDSLKELELGGPSSILQQNLEPVGVPLYFSVHAENSAGARSTATCVLPTYDVTLPTGRLLAEFTSTSNPTTIKASVVIHEDSELSAVYVGAGFGKGSYGDQLSSWSIVSLAAKAPEVIPDDPLNLKSMEYFSELREGKLVSSKPIQTLEKIVSVQYCAGHCLKLDHCVSINFDFGDAGTCELMKSIQSFDESLSNDGLFYHYERKNAGHSMEFAYTDFFMKHGYLHYVNLDMTNILGYNNIVSSSGIITDFTCPGPGGINITSDTLETVDCASIIPPDRLDYIRLCTGVDSSIKNHRIIIDGANSSTLFNGLEPMEELRYTRKNAFLAANWDGIHDNETGILVYSLSFGHQVCQDALHPHHDPHRHLTHESHWTHTGLVAGTAAFPLPSGKYFASIRALNKVQYGGPLSTTICHTTPLVIDMTKPFMYEVYNIKYREDSYLVSFTHNSSDPESDIRSNDMCFGTRPSNCEVMDWVQSSFSPEASFTFRLPDGVPAWLHVRVTNNVDLHAVGRADQAIVVDTTPPLAGLVFDGPLYKEDMEFTKDIDQMCANWVDFYDPDTGITSYTVGVGTMPNLTDVTDVVKLKSSQSSYCVQLNSTTQLVHDNTYYFLVLAANGGINQKNVTLPSNGVRVDLTPPNAGEVVDGRLAGYTDLQYSAKKSTADTQWRNFSDPESGIRQYNVQVQRKSNGSIVWEVLQDWTMFSASTYEAAWNNFHLKHKDTVKSTVRATNNALNTVALVTNGFLVDLTPPQLYSLGDGSVRGHDLEYQNEQSYLEVNFEFSDPESHLSEYRLQVFRLTQGNKQQVAPASPSTWQSVSNVSLTSYRYEGLSLDTSSLYFIRMTAVNGAGLTSIHETTGVRVDITPPTVVWVRVGVLAGEKEELLDGYVYTADHEGIKVSWLAYDYESGITGIQYSVGTTSGAQDVKGWTVLESLTQDAYISVTLTDSDRTLANPAPVYYVSIKIKNGAQLWSNVFTSVPIIVVPEDKAGIVVDGPNPNLGDDVDYQADQTTLSVSFVGFESSLNGLQKYDWAIGTTPEGEDVMPFLEYGVTHNETASTVGNGLSSSGFGHTSLYLEPGITYYTTVRAITHAGNVLQSTTDGFMVDHTVPFIHLERLSSASPVTSMDNLYQYDPLVFEASWIYNDSQVKDTQLEDNIDSNWFSVGSYPGGVDVCNITAMAGLPNQEISLALGTVTPLLAGKPNILSVFVKNKAGLTGEIISPAVLQDSSSPEPGRVECSPFVQSHLEIECSWSGFSDKESQITKYLIGFGSEMGIIDILGNQELPGYTTSITTSEPTKQHADILYATVTAVNSVGLNISAFSGPIKVDDTPPESGVVVEIASSARIDPYNNTRTVDLNTKACQTVEECLMLDAVCIETVTHLAVAWTHFTDPESGIHKYLLAVGSTPGGGQIMPFIEIDSTLNFYMIEGLNLLGQRQVFVTIKGENQAGLGTGIYSNGVYISYLSQGLAPLSTVAVWDTETSAFGDIQFQTISTQLEAEWDVTGDPCPAIQYEWAIERTDGLVLQNFTNMNTNTRGINPQLELDEGSRYYSLLRVTNALGYVFTLRSDGVTVSSFPLLPGSVYDGGVLRNDLSVQTSLSTVSANWEGFGLVKEEVNVEDILTGNQGVQTAVRDPNQEIAYYEVGLGTDRRLPETRDNVVPFTNAWLNETITFNNLDLISGTAIYYFTVIAHSTTYATATVTSNGFYVTDQGQVTAGTINVNDYVSTDTYLEVPWSSFLSQHDMMLYYIALSNHTDAANESCQTYISGGSATEARKAELFNIEAIRSTGISTFVRLTGLSLEQNHSYVVWVVGVDKAGECATAYHQFTVDITNPSQGQIKGGPFYNMTIAYQRSTTEVSVMWDGFEDLDSGIDTFNVTLLTQGSCASNNIAYTAVAMVTMDGNQTEYIFTNTTLLAGTLYFVNIIATNRAGLTSTARTSPLVYDESSPTAGHVTEGTEWTSDIVWWGSTSQVSGVILHQTVPGPTCQPRSMSLRDGNWTVLNIPSLEDPAGIDWLLVHRPENIQMKNLTEDVTIKISRDTKYDIIYTAAYSRNADMLKGGNYELDIQAANCNGNAVTGVTFWDADNLNIHLYDHTFAEDWTNVLCDCCLDTPIMANCSSVCDCPAILANVSDTFTSTPRTTPISQTSCGFQLYAGPSPYIVSWCKFYNDTLDDMSVYAYLTYDPSASAVRYHIAFDVVKEDLTESWCMRVEALDRQLTEMCGIPALSNSTKVILHAWNKNNYMPPLSVYNNWEGRATFDNLIFPPDPEAYCRYGEPFVAGTIPIIQYEAGIGTNRTTPDVAPFTVISEPCLPCSDACSQILCDPSCSTSGQSLIPFTLNNLTLSTNYNGTYYLIVRSMLGSGATAVSFSDGFAVDTTSPEFDPSVMLYIDVNQGDFTPVEYQSSNSTIKAVWLCSDDNTEIQEYEWAIGTTPCGSELQNFTSTGTAASGINTNLTGLLEHNTTYYVSVRCINEAGLSTTLNFTSGVTVLLESPSPDSVNATAVGASHFNETVYPETALKSEDPTSTGESWDVSTDPSISRYDFCVGSSMEVIDDIVPCIWVGVNTSGEVEVKNGKLYMNGIAYYNISELQDLSVPTDNVTLLESTSSSTSSSSSSGSNEFNMEVGRTIFLHMRLCNKAEICSNKFINSVLIESSTSTLQTSTNGEPLSIGLQDSSSGITGRRKRSTTISVQIDTPSGLGAGQSVLVNQLNDTSLSTSYTSGASTNFAPYVVNPSTTITETERRLVGRIQSVEMVFTLTSVGQTVMPGPILVTYSQTNTSPQPSDMINTLIHWNPDLSQWQQTDQTCLYETDTLVHNTTSSTSTVKVCDTRQNADNTTTVSNGMDVYFSMETEFAIVTALAGYVNNAPYLVSNSTLETTEDATTVEFVLEAADNDTDPIIFSMDSTVVTTVIGNVSVNSIGVLTLALCNHCYGSVLVNLTLVDVPIISDITPAVTIETLNITILEQNDPPSIFLLNKDGSSKLQPDKTEPVEIYIDEILNGTLEVDLGILVAFDVDGYQNLTIQVNTTNINGTFIIQDYNITSGQRLLDCSNDMCRGESIVSNLAAMDWQSKTLVYHQNANFTGIDTIKVVAEDSSGTFSDVLTIQIAVVINKCQNGGVCTSLSASKYTCDNIQRTTDFDTYYTCTCTPAWRGQYCEEDVDECVHYKPCKEAESCRNSIGSYECYCDNDLCKVNLLPWHLVLILLCILLAAGAAIGGYLIWRYKKNKSVVGDTAYRTKRQWNSPNGQGVYICVCCGQMFKELQSLKEHMVNHKDLPSVGKKMAWSLGQDNPSYVPTYDATEGKTLLKAKGQNIQVLNRKTKGQIPEMIINNKLIPAYKFSDLDNQMKRHPSPRPVIVEANMAAPISTGMLGKEKIVPKKLIEYNFTKTSSSFSDQTAFTNSSYIDDPIDTIDLDNETPSSGIASPDPGFSPFEADGTQAPPVGTGITVTVEDNEYLKFKVPDPHLNSSQNPDFDNVPDTLPIEVLPPEPPRTGKNQKQKNKKSSKKTW